MATESELKSFDDKWSGVKSQVPPIGMKQVQQIVPNDAVAQFNSKWSSSVNAPPTGISATPTMTQSDSEGRKDLTGEIVPIDDKSGISTRDYLGVAFQRDPESKAKVLSQMYPDRKVRILDSGDVTLEMIDSKGKSRDVVLNPAGMDSHDLIDLATQTPEIAASIATALATQGRGLLKRTAQIVMSSLAGAIAGGAKDVGARGSEGLPVNFGEIKSERGKQAVLDMFMQGGIGLGTKALRVASPFAGDVKPGSLAYDARAGAAFLRDTFGEEIKLTPAEQTGSSALAAIEAVESKQPGARNIFGKMREQRDAVVQNIQRKGTQGLRPEEEIGDEAINIIRNKEVLPVENALNDALRVADEKGGKRVRDLIDQSIGLKGGDRLTPLTAGTSTLDEFDAKLSAAKVKVDAAYAKVNELPGGSGEVLSGSPAARAASEIRKELPTVLKKESKDTGLLDEFGDPMKTEVEKAKVLGSGVPEGLMKALDDLESLKGGKVSLQTLTNMKRAAYDEIAKTEAVPGVKERWFNKIAGAYEKGIQEGIDEAGDPALKSALTNAKDTYKKELLPFDRPGVREMAKSEFDVGRPDPEKIVDRLLGSSSNYNLVKDTLGENSPSLRMLKRAWVDNQIAKATDGLGEVSPEKLSGLFKSMADTHPELSKEIFGKNYESISSSLAINSALKKIGSLSESEVKALLSLKDPTVSDLIMVIKMEANKSNAYVNGIVRDIADGLPIASKIKPTELIQRLENAKTPTKDVEQILATIQKESPETREAIATLKFFKILDSASVVEGETVTKKMAGQPVNLSATKLEKALGNPNTPEGMRNRLLLGEGSIGTEGKATREEVLNALGKILAPSEQSGTAFSAFGGMSAGSQVGQATRNPATYVTNFAKKYLLADLYLFRPGIVKAIANNAMTPDRVAAITNAVIVSEPFLRRLVENVGPDKADVVVQSLKKWIDQTVTDYLDSPKGREGIQTQKFMQGQQVPMQIRPTP